tara:strand:+ start:2313 stop:2498 length:186 start_codon:yes stop_codon:yes gene_type:complete
MTIYRYVVHSHPSNVGEGTMFETIGEAREFVLQYGEQGACISEVAFEFADSELVEDTRNER